MNPYFLKIYLYYSFNPYVLVRHIELITKLRSLTGVLRTLGQKESSLDLLYHCCKEFEMGNRKTISSTCLNFQEREGKVVSKTLLEDNEKTHGLHSSRTKIVLSHTRENEEAPITGVATARFSVCWEPFALDNFGPEEAQVMKCVAKVYTVSEENSPEKKFRRQ